MPLTLYSVSDGPPSAACRMLLKHLNVDYNLIEVDFANGDHMTKEYAEKNPQKEIPVLDDHGFCLSESNAILQYIADKYGKNSGVYSEDLKIRAVINQRLAFNLSTYYKSILEYVILPMFYDYKRDDFKLKKLKTALDIFETYLKKENTKYAIGDNLTIADIQFCASTMCLEAINFDTSPYQHITKWYKTIKAENPGMWKIAENAMNELSHFNKNPPDLKKLSPHPNHPIKK